MMDRTPLLAGLALGVLWPTFWLTPLRRLLSPRQAVQASAGLGMGLLIAKALATSTGGGHG